MSPIVGPLVVGRAVPRLNAEPLVLGA